MMSKYFAAILWICALGVPGGLVTPYMARANGAPLIHRPDETGGTDLPPVLADGFQTRSLFDSVANVGENGEPRETIFPFSKLMERVTRLSGGDSEHALRPILIPFSRALERQYASLRFPRALFGVDTYPAESPETLGYFLKDRLFVGFSKLPKVLEVISFNERASRFEFQLVTDYAEGPYSNGSKAPRVVYANRSLCITCHKNHGPMFSQGPWSETNGNSLVAEEMKRFHDGNSEYEGITIAPGTNDIAHNFDLSTDAANLLMPLNRVWTEWCGTSGVRGNRCRTLLLQLGLSWALDQAVDEGSLRYEELTQLLREEFTQQGNRGFEIPKFDLNNRDPLTLGGGLSGGPISSSMAANVPEPNARLEDLVRRFNLPAAFEPAKDACHVPPGESFGFPMIWDDPVAHGLILIYSLDRFFSPGDFRRLALASGNKTSVVLGAVEKLDETLLGARPLVRGEIMQGLIRALTPESSIPSSPTDLKLGMPISTTDGQEVHEVLGKDPRVAPFWNSCRECHLKYPVDFSQARSDAEILKVISNPAVARKMYVMLDWENDPPSPGPMPRKGSRQYKALVSDEARAKSEGRRSIRQEMLETLKGFMAN